MGSQHAACVPQLVIVVGAGPAGLSVANRLSKDGHQVVVLNRDIKFGGLAEYGIFPSKYKLRGGLRKTYVEILSRPNVHYFGNVCVGDDRHVTVEELRKLGASALVFATGAQGTKSIGVEGEGARGVFHAKDVVYHYNGLPEFAAKPFEIGRHVAIIGIGDVMVDLAHWLIRYKKIERVTAVVRRGPAERKYNPKEIRAVCANIDRDELACEFDRIAPRLTAAGQDPAKIQAEMTAEFTKCEPRVSETRMGFRFLSSPRRVLTDAQNRVRALELEDTKLEPKGDDFAAVGLKTTSEFGCDTVIFAVGDRVDDRLGLPYKNGTFATNPKVGGGEPDEAWFQVYDERTGRVLDGLFVAGWARQASVGLVGIAKRDGEWCYEVVSNYLAAKAPLADAEIHRRLSDLRRFISARQPLAVDRDEILKLTLFEEEQARRQAMDEFKYARNEEMLSVVRGLSPRPT
jgi:ferredoxin--NADP+ reductase